MLLTEITLLLPRKIMSCLFLVDQNRDFNKDIPIKDSEHLTFTGPSGASIKNNRIIIIISE